MKKYKALFQGDDVLLTIDAKNATEARKILNKQITFEVSKPQASELSSDAEKSDDGKIGIKGIDDQY